MVARRVLILFAMALTVLVALPLGGSAQGNSDNAKRCQKGSWALLARAEAPYTVFGNQGECVSYGAHGGEIVSALPFVEITIGTLEGDRCTATWELINAAAVDGEQVYVESFFNNGFYHWYLHASSPERSGPISQGSYITSSTASVVDSGESVEVFYPTKPCGG